MTVTALNTTSNTNSDVAWEARVDLAAAHRLAVDHGFNEGIFNHLTLAVPGTTDRYLQIPFGVHWAEVSASTFMEVSYDGERLSGEGEIEQSCYAIHAPLHRLVPTASCVMHTHMPFASALSRLEDPRILPIGQTEVAIMRMTGYDMDYAGPAFDPAEGERLAGLIGDKSILVMANHGALTIGNNVAEAYDRLYYLERVAQAQLYAMWTGRPLHVLSDEVIEKSIAEFKKAPRYGGKPSSQHHFEALRRLLDKKDTGYQD
jgi:ribulose-5-phosphate 4-epimerase/fuculose-1-phosphate aldolase